MEVGRENIQTLVERGAVLHARLLDGYETTSTPVYWLDYRAGQLRYCRTGKAERVHEYEIAAVECAEDGNVVFHTTGETSVAALIVTAIQTVEDRSTLSMWAYVVRRDDPYPEDGWRFRG